MSKFEDLLEKFEDVFKPFSKEEIKKRKEEQIKAAIAALGKDADNISKKILWLKFWWEDTGEENWEKLRNKWCDGPKNVLIFMEDKVDELEDEEYFRDEYSEDNMDDMIKDMYAIDPQEKFYE